MSQNPAKVFGIDVLEYHLKMEPNIQQRSVQGEVKIKLLNNDKRKEIIFNSGSLIIDDVKGENVKSYQKNKHLLTINLLGVEESEYNIEISFHGNPDRTLVYYKGAYVIHLLQEELGDETFWKGIKYYSKLNFGKSVVTKDFQSAMEKAANKKLSYFFDKWVYNNER